MKSYKWHTILFLLVLIIIQPFLAQWMKVGGVKINFVIYFTMLFAFTKKPTQSLALAIVLGLIYDMAYSIWIGKMIIVLIMATAFVTILDKRIYRENIPALIFFFIVSIFLIENVNTVLEIGFLDFIRNFVLIQVEIFWMAVYSGALSVITGAIYLVASLKGDRRVSMKGTG
ncbi:MAG: hypothetical protein JXN10_10460 [Clostridia bacterium]|nr:hypothetical protein [Clostridia bacterium]